ncbi:TrkA C-terminal domain-containing protein [Virgibacillus salexigens]|uniref:TrkA C-terminal domain-containing protein n=2 Tax=Bacillaceae TaxID=186817 RepID=UPI0011DDC7CE
MDKSLQRFPPAANIIIILRDGETISPTAKTKLFQGDVLYILAPDNNREDLDLVLREEN